MVSGRRRIRRPPKSRPAILDSSRVHAGVVMIYSSFERRVEKNNTSYNEFHAGKNTPELLGLSFKHWLAGSLKDHWVSLSEFLSMQLIDNQKKQGTVKSALYNNYLSKITKLPLEIRNENKNCFLIPSGTAKSITVIIPFRNEADRTLKCVYSVLMQKSDAFIDIILIRSCDLNILT